MRPRMFFGPQTAWAGLPYAAVFVVGLWLARRLELSAERVWLLGLALIALGNLAQAGSHMGIVRPTYI